jgi:hypothetical protein
MEDITQDPMVGQKMVSLTHKANIIAELVLQMPWEDKSWNKPIDACCIPSLKLQELMPK